MLREMFKSSAKDELLLFFDIETSGLNPLVDRVVSIGFSNHVCEDVLIDVDEARLLNQFWRFVDGSDFVLVGYNISDFDLFFLKARSLKLGVVLPVRLRYIDLYEVWCKPAFKKKGKLSEVLDHAGVVFKRRTEKMGDSVPELWEAGDWDEIVKHNADDIEATKLLFYRMRACGFL